MTHLTLNAVVYLPAAAFALATLIYVVVRSPLIASAILLVIFVLSEGIRDHYSLSIAVSGIRVSAMDTITLIFLVVGVYRAVTLGVGTATRGVVLGLVFLLMVHFVRGLADFGLQDAANHTRLWLYFLAPLVYAATVTTPWDERVWKLVAATGVLLVLISIPYILVQGLPSASKQIQEHGETVASRPIVASGALVILQATIILLVLRRPSSRSPLYLAAFTAGGVVILQHRTVWVAAIAVALVGFVSWSRRRLEDAPALVSLLTGLLLLCMPVAIWAFVSSRTLTGSVTEATKSQSTFTWRTTGWEDLITSHHSLSDVITGGPAGASWERSVFGQDTSLSPHSAFVEAYLRFGVPGIVLICALGISLFRLRRRLPPRVGLSSHAVTLLLVSQVLFAITYTLNEVQGLMIGVLVSALAAGHVRQQDTAPILTSVEARPYRMIRNDVLHAPVGPAGLRGG